MDARARRRNALPVALARPWRLWRARRQVSTSENVGPSLNDLERTAERLHAWSHLVRRPEVEKQHAVLVFADHFFETRRQLDAPPGSQPALEHRELKPIPISLDDRQNTAPTSPVRNVVGDDEQHTAPSKRIETHISSYKRMKPVAGPQDRAKNRPSCDPGGLPAFRALAHPTRKTGRRRPVEGTADLQVGIAVLRDAKTRVAARWYGGGWCGP